MSFTKKQLDFVGLPINAISRKPNKLNVNL